MNHGVKLTFFFTLSVALHGAGLWAAAGRIETRAAGPAAEVAIVDRDLFFRHSARLEAEASPSLSSSPRLVSRSGDAVTPSAPGDNVMPAPAGPAARSPPAPGTAAQAPAEAVARLDPSTVEALSPPRREAAAREVVETERREPLRMSGIAAAAPPLAETAPRLERSSAVARPPARPETEAQRRSTPLLPPADDAAEAARARATAALDAPRDQPVRLSVEAGAELARTSPGEALARTAAEAAARSEADVAPNLEPGPLPVAEPAPAMAAEESQRLEQATPSPAAGRPPAAALPDRQARPLDPAAASAADRQPALRGTLPPPRITSRETTSTQPAGLPVAVAERSSPDASRLRPAPPGTLAIGPARVAGVPRQAAPPAERSAVRPPAPAPSRTRPAPPPPPPPPVVQAAPRDLAALTPVAPPWREEVSKRDLADRFTRSYQGGECFFPMPLASRDGARIRGYGLQAESIRMFRQAFAQALGADPEIDWRPLTDAQCSSISFTRLILAEAAPSIHIGLRSKGLRYGEELAGWVTGSRFEFVTLLVVDDSGVVHNVLEYLRPASGQLEFSVPVHPVDDGSDRVQLIMAIGASLPLPALQSATAMHSDDFFPELLRQARAAGASLELGLEDFVILGGSS